MKKLLPLFALISATLLYAQCPSNGNFTSQSEIDAFSVNFPNCDQLNTLSISGADITDLTPLSNLILIDGLIVSNNPLLTSLAGLENIDVTTVMGDQTGLLISNNATLLSIANLPNFQETSALFTIQDNPQLQNLTGVDLSQVANQFFIRNNDALTNLTGLMNLTDADLIIENNDGLIDLSGISIDFSSSELVLSNNIALQSLNGLGEAPREFGITLDNNPSLTDISQIESYNLSAVNITNNSSLSVCSYSSICYAVSNPPIDGIFISNNASGCDTENAIQSGCIPQIPDNDECVNAQSISLGEIVSSSTSFSTRSSIIPSCGNNSYRADVWYTFNSGSLNTVDIGVSNGFYLQLWEGDCASLIQVSNACGENLLNEVPVSNNTNYIIQVWKDLPTQPGGRMLTANDFVLSVEDSTLALDQHLDAQVNVYPNPVNNFLSIERIPNYTFESYQLYSIYGERISSGNEQIIRMSSFSSGVYLLELIFLEGRVVKKIVKQ